ncbi:hypothetical protein BHM03_00001115 [Ensete ventricosum]|uniref:RRM domain-containing protein n=1 Tax=Ensete ventricosum TaxID=4639 RepID=A0A445M8Z1_ENSVE|nr:hypothetical protein BHM03_00001115 [Ensete ventricosum]
MSHSGNTSGGAAMHRRESTANDDDQPHGDDFQRSEETDDNERRIDPSTPPPPPTSPHEQSRSEEYDEHYGDLNIGEDFIRNEEAVGIRDGNATRTDPSTVPPTPLSGNERLGSQSRGAGSAGGSEETGGLLDGGGGQTGDTSLLVSELHWWTTDADLKAELCKYGRVKEINFDERDNGQSNGTCIVDFYDPMAAAACGDGMNGHVFNDRPCVVEWAPPPIGRGTLALPAQARASGGGDGSMLPCPRVAATPPPPPSAAAPPPPSANPSFFRVALPSPPLAAAPPPPPPPMNQASFGSMLRCPPAVALPPTVNPAATCPPVSAVPLSPTVNPAFFGSMLQCPPVSSAAPLSPPTVNPAFFGWEATSAGAAAMWLNPGMGARWGVEEQPSKGEDSMQRVEASNEKKDRTKPETDRETQRDTETGRSRSQEAERDETPWEASEGEGDRDGHGAGDRHVDRHSHRVALQHEEVSHGKKKDDVQMPQRDREPSPSAK